jgi:heat shock protein HtpX
VAATIAATIMMVSRFAMFFGGAARSDDREGGGGNPLVLLLTIVLAPLAALLIQAAISRSREFDADAGGASIAGSPLGLASALRKIEAASKAVPLDANPATAHMFIIKPGAIAGLMTIFSTHPSTEARIDALLHHAPGPLA